MADDPDEGLEKNWAKIKAQIEAQRIEPPAAKRRRSPPAWAIAGVAAAAAFAFYVLRSPDPSGLTVKGTASETPGAVQCDIEPRTDDGTLVPVDGKYLVRPGTKVLLAARCSEPLYLQVRFQSLGGGLLEDARNLKVGPDKALIPAGAYVPTVADGARISIVGTGTPVPADAPFPSQGAYSDVLTVELKK
jgi:hypothetical protein